MRKFIIEYSDGSLSIVTVLDGSTNEEIIAKCPTYQTNTGYRDVVDNDIPTDHVDFRPAWCDGIPGQQIDVCHQKARDYSLEELRKERNKELDRLDAEKTRADEIGDTALSTSILADKNTLRDCTEALKNLSVSGHNDPVVLNDIRTKRQLPTINN